MSVKPGTTARADDTKRFRLALLEALDNKRGKSRLHEVAEKLIEAALDGDLHAIRDIRDIVDGKPGVISEAPASIERIERIIVDTQDQDGAGVPAAAHTGPL